MPRVDHGSVEHVAQQAPAGSARPLHASHTCSGDPRSTCGTGRAAREVPSIQQVPLLSMSRDLTTHKRARPTVDWARETSARRTRALQTRGQHAAPVAPLERRQGPWSAVRWSHCRLRTPYVTAPRLLRPKVDSASHVRSDLVRIRALYTPGAQASNHSIMEARSPFSGRFAASEISR